MDNVGRIVKAIDNLGGLIKSAFKLESSITPRHSLSIPFSTYAQYTVPVPPQPEARLRLYTVPEGFKLHIKRFGVITMEAPSTVPGLYTNLALNAPNGASPIIWCLSISGRENLNGNVGQASWNIWGDSAPSEYIDEAFQNDTIDVVAKRGQSLFAITMPAFLARIDGQLELLNPNIENKDITSAYARSIGLQDIDGIADREEETQT